MNTKRILLVDDHAVVRRGLVEILQDEIPSAEFGEADNSVSALDQVRAQPWDVVVLDISLPGRSGLDVLKDIHAIRPELPVLVLSVHPEEQYARRVLQAGAAGYMTKECAPEQLAAAVEKILRGGTYVSGLLAEQFARDIAAREDKLPHERLSDREFEVLRQIATGRTVSEIAKDMRLSVKTISTYRTRILEKTGLKNNADMMKYSLHQGLVS